MKTENKMRELKDAARDAHIAKEAAKVFRNTRWEIFLKTAGSTNTHNYMGLYKSDWNVYRAASEAFNAACEEARDAANTANAYEVGEYETNPYVEDK